MEAGFSGLTDGAAEDSGSGLDRSLTVDEADLHRDKLSVLFGLEKWCYVADVGRRGRKRPGGLKPHLFAYDGAN